MSLRRYIQDKLPIVSVSGDTTPMYGSRVAYSSGSYTVNLLTAVGMSGKSYTITNNGTGIITINPFGSETIFGENTFLLYQLESIDIFSDGNNWNL